MLSKIQGIFAGRLFHGLSDDQAIKTVYGESADLFSKIIKKEFDSGSEINVLDLGSHRGEFLQDLISKLDDYKIKTTAVEINEDDLNNNIAQVKINSNLIEIPIEDKCFDITLCRYVLAWNSLENQQKIIGNIKRLTKGIAIIQHQGSKNNSDLLKTSADDLFDGQIDLLKRDEFYFSNADELKNIFESLQIKYDLIQDREVKGLSNILIKKYSLSEEDAKLTKEILKDSDYIVQTTFVLDFRN
ncbi:MAG: hypothetical protein RL150_675 [Candidatus Parcubacteria bacterium]|jgi:SAM-dependent methyltransferase